MTTFSPSVYEHAARLLGRSPWDVSRDATLLYAGHRAAYLRYRHVPVVVGIDIYNLETGTMYVICNVETDQLRFVERVAAQRPDVTVRVNMDPGVVACNDKERIHREIDRILKITKGHPNCMLGTGGLPYETPVSNVDLIRDYWNSVWSN